MLEVRDLTFRFNDGSQALSPLSFHVNPGQIYCMLGPGGAGKSTLMDALLGHFKPFGGRVLVNGIDAAEQPIGFRRHIAYISPRMALCEVFTPVRNVRYMLRLFQSPISDPMEIANALRDVGLPDRALARPFRELSLEHRMATGLAVAMLRHVPVLLADEPAAGLDPAGTDRLHAGINKLRSQGTSILYATHDPYFARFADVVGVLRHGRLVYEKPMAYLAPEALERIYRRTDEQ